MNMIQLEQRIDENTFFGNSAQIAPPTNKKFKQISKFIFWSISKELITGISMPNNAPKRWVLSF